MLEFARLFFLFLLILVPLVGAGEGHWSRAFAEIGALGLLVLCLVLGNRDCRERPFYMAPGLALLGGLVLLAAFQMVPLPQWLLRLISPATWRLYAETIWEVNPGAWMPLSVEPSATLGEILRLLAWGAIYLAAVQLHVSREQQKRAATVLVLFWGAFSLIGILRLLLPSVGLWKLTASLVPAGAFFGMLADTDHFAAFLAMGLPLALAWYLAQKPRVIYAGLRGQLVELFSLTPNRLYFFYGLSALLMVAAIFLSSRPLVLAVALSVLMAYGIALIARKVYRGRGVVITLFAALLLGAVGFLHWGVGVQGPLHRWVSVENGLAGPVAPGWDGLRVLRSFPLAGTGYGTMEQVAGRFPGDATTGTAAFLLQGELGRVLGEGGLAAGGLFGAFVLLVLRQGWQSWRRRKSRTSIGLFLGSFSGAIALLVLGLFEPLLDSEALGFYFFFLLGFSVAVANTRSRSREQQSDLPPVPPRLVARALVPAVLVFAAAFLVWGGQLAARAAIGDTAGHAESSPEAAESIYAALEEAGSAARLAPLNARYRFAMGDGYLSLEDVDQALPHFAAALRLSPLGGEYLQRLGLVYDSIGQQEKAGKLLEAGVANEPRSAERHKVYALWLVSRNRMEDAADHFRMALALQPAKAGDYLLLMGVAGVPEETVRRVLPENSAVWMGFGDYLLGRGDPDGAEASYLNAVRFAGQEADPGAAPFWRLYDFYQGRNRPREALEAVLAGIRSLPDLPQFRQAAATLYMQQGITYRAIEEFRKALLLDPGNDLARQRLDELSAGP